MEAGTKTLRHKSMFFVFTEKDVFLFPEDEYNSFKQDKEGYTCLKRKYFSDVTDRDVERVICIVCHEEAKLEDFVSPLCRQMHFVLCRECIEYLKKRTNKREVACPYCKENKSDKAYQEEILGVLFSLMPHKTLHSIELKPDMEVKTATKLTRETKVVLSQITITAPLFFRLMARTAVRIKKRISLFGYDDSLDWCIGKLGWRTSGRTTVSVYRCNKEEIKWIAANTSAEENRTLSPWKIRRDESNVCAFLKCWVGINENSGHNNSSLELSKEEPTKNILGEGNSSIWVGKVKKLILKGHAVEILPKIKLHGENVLEELELDASYEENIADIFRMESKSIWVGKVKKLKLLYFGIEILPKLRMHGENVMKELALYAEYRENIAEIFRMENNTIWVGRVKNLILGGGAIDTLPKLRIHEENVMVELNLWENLHGYIAEIIRIKNNSIWVGKVKKLSLKHNGIEILPKLRIHGENVLEELSLSAKCPTYITGILKE
ncbi:MAG: uncharacterized protein A8A55_2021, partial [Amphiamblys sp. WSBS2006]